MSFNRRQLGAHLLSLTGVLLLPDTSQASTAIGLKLKQLVKRSERVIVGTPVAYRCGWWHLAGARRIVTWTRILQEDNWLADKSNDASPTDEIELLTLGGRVGDLAQKVPGEATPRVGERSLFFLSGEYEQVHRVIGMAQGHYPLDSGDSDATLHKSRTLPHLIASGPSGSPRLRHEWAVHVLPGKNLSTVKRLVNNVR